MPWQLYRKSNAMLSSIPALGNELGLAWACFGPAWCVLNLRDPV